MAYNNNNGIDITEYLITDPSQQTSNYSFCAEPEDVMPFPKSRQFSVTRNVIVIVVAFLFMISGFISVGALAVSGGSSASSNIKLGNRYLNSLEYQQAIIEFEQALSIAPNNAKAYLGLANAYVEMGDIDRAIDILNEGYEITENKKLLKRIEELEKITDGFVA
ncbi:MAG: tetratricopeptide repeat protein, partial [Oscillospiraceae bacterium]